MEFKYCCKAYALLGSDGMDSILEFSIIIPLICDLPIYADILNTPFGNSTAIRVRIGDKSLLLYLCNKEYFLNKIH